MGDDVETLQLHAVNFFFLHHHALVTNEGRNHLHKQVHDKEAYLQNHCMHA